MKRIILVLLALTMLTVSSRAQEASNEKTSYCVRYVQDHQLLTKDSGINVLDYEIEWPEIIDFNKSEKLKALISKDLTNSIIYNLDTLLLSFHQTYGEPKRGKFKTIPDDDRFCYITYKAKIVGYKKGSWIAYNIESKIAPQKESRFRASDGSHVIVYDISRDRILTAKDIIDKDVVMREEPQEFYDLLFAPLSDEEFNNMVACEIDGVWLDQDNINFLVSAISNGKQLKYVAPIPAERYSYVLSHLGRKAFFKPAKQKINDTITLPTIWRGEHIYNNVEIDKQPAFNGSSAGLRNYLRHSVKPDIQYATKKEVTLNFLIAKDGSIHDVSVISPASPILDRHAVTLIKGMPNYNPGESKGKKVVVRAKQTITYAPNVSK